MHYEITAQAEDIVLLVQQDASVLGEKIPLEDDTMTYVAL